MELVLKSNNEESLAKIIALAKKLNVVIEKKNIDPDQTSKGDIRNRILNFKAEKPSSFGDAAEWERDLRSDRELPFQ
ncbi:MAG TPA: hypothetical protein VIM55_19430 [Mucilaginibacter sp.]